MDEILEISQIVQTDSKSDDNPDDISNDTRYEFKCKATNENEELRTKVWARNFAEAVTLADPEERYRMYETTLYFGVWPAKTIVVKR